MYLLCLNNIPNASAHHLCQIYHNDLYICAIPTLLVDWWRGIVMDLLPMLNPNDGLPIYKKCICGSDWIHLHIKFTAIFVIGIHLCSLHGKLKEQLTVLLLEIGTIYHHFFQTHPQLI